MKTITKRDDFNTSHNCTWCPGCGNYTIWYMLKQALLELGLQSHEVVIVYGIGCAGNGANFTDVYAFHGLHGRALPVAQGVKLANEGLKVIVMGGDGDGMGIGVGHFIHACRRNIDITYILHDNQIYGLTTGQTSPRSDKGFVTKTTPEGNVEEPVNPITLALSSNCSFISRSYSGSPHHLKDTLKKAIQHKGFSFVDVLQPCITFNKQNTYGWYTSRIYELDKQPDHDTANRSIAWERANEWGDKIPLGVFYQQDKPTYEDQMHLKSIPAQKELIAPVDISSLLKKYKI
jgi:2-oxoglutarate/2-oxoacid ferredoxin oxidoreductase subunit beta